MVILRPLKEKIGGDGRSPTVVMGGRERNENNGGGRSNVSAQKLRKRKWILTSFAK